MKKFIQYYQEIIEKDEFQKNSKYRKEVTKTFSAKKWLKAHKLTRELFKKLSPDGSFKQTIVIPMNSTEGTGKKLSAAETKEMKAFLKKNGYFIDDTLWNAGYVTKNKKGDTKILQVAKSFINNVKNNYQKIQDQIDKMILQVESGKFDKTIVDSKKKKIEELREKLKEMRNDEDINQKYIEIFDKTSSSSKYDNTSMVFSLVPRAIASQSTKVAWDSCQNLDHGAYREKVGSGMSNGTFVVFLADNDDTGELKGPIARVLVKPFIKEDDKSKVYWYVDQVYPKGTNAKFRQAVIQILKKHNMKSEDGRYKLPEGVYQDTEGGVIIDDVWRYVQDGDFSDLEKKPKEFIQKMFERYPKEVIMNWDFDVPFPNIEIENLDLSNTDIRKLPRGIKAKNLNLSGTNIGPVLFP